MEIGAITSYIDVAQLVLYAFWVFFAGLIFYLRREDRREGYPLDSEVTGKPIDPGLIWVPEPKEFVFADGSRFLAPDPDRRDSGPIAAEPIEGWSGAPLYPTGDPMVDGVGPAAYSMRADVPDLTVEGEPKIVPMKVAEDFSVVEQDPDPRGMEVFGADGRVAGTVCDIWVDRAEPQIRYLEVEVEVEVAAESADAKPAEQTPEAETPQKSGDGETPQQGTEGQTPAKAGEGKTAQQAAEAPAPQETAVKTVLLPIAFARISRSDRLVNVQSILADQFANVPTIKNPGEVTRLEEDRICAYYGGGTLYAIPERLEPLV